MCGARAIRWSVGITKSSLTCPLPKNFSPRSFQVAVSSRENFYLCLSKMCALINRKQNMRRRFLLLTENKEAACRPLSASRATFLLAPDPSPSFFLPP